MTITEAHFKYLDDLRESGETNMFGAGSYVQSKFFLDRMDTRYVVTQWMATFSDKPVDERVKAANEAGIGVIAGVDRYGENMPTQMSAALIRSVIEWVDFVEDLP